MGGAAKVVKNAFSAPGRAIETIGTFGTSELARKAVPGIGTVLDTPDRLMGFKRPSAPMAATGSTMSPMEMLTTTGGAPLLTSIALGAKSDDALASFFGVSPADWPNYLKTLSPSEQSSISGLSTQLNQISINTDLRNRAINKLTEDFPKYMASAVPQYAHIMDDATKQAVNDALDRSMGQIGAKYAAGGQLSSGATVAAGARAATEMGVSRAEANTKYGTDMALQDWSNKYSAAAALQNFQQKMLGQGATQGFNAVQNALSGNRQVQLTNAGFANERQMGEQGTTNAMFGALGQLGGTAIGATLFGPVGAAVGSKVGGDVASGKSGFTDNPRLNLRY